MTVVLDASAMLGVIFNEPGADIVRAAREDAVISSVNLAEAVKTISRRLVDDADVREVVRDYQVSVIAPDEEQAILAGLLDRATRAVGLSLGDRFCLALARQLGRPVLTADRAWTRVADAAGVSVRLIR